MADVQLLDALVSSFEKQKSRGVRWLPYQITKTLIEKKQLAAAPAAVLSILYTRTYAIWMNEKHPRESEVIKNIHLLRQTVGQKFETFMSKEELSPEQIKLARAYITQLADPKAQGDCYEKLQYKVPYFNQRDSAHPGVGDSMCNMSSMAMGLALFGVSNPKPDIQYDDAVEQIRVDHYPSYKRTGEGQFRISNHFGYKYESLDGKGSETGLWGGKESYSYDWYVQHALPHLRKGNSITIGIALGEHGHIVHLLGITKQGLSVHNPYGRVDFEQTDYAKAMNNFANTREGVGSDKGKKEFWSFEAIKNSPKLHISWIRVTRPK
ncbi:MAG: hypothetical protein HC880_10345 [Bacteroidia bacterium]|nr:hypothetical protein [Bacteroidia bacterium]